MQRLRSGLPALFPLVLAVALSLAFPATTTPRSPLAWGSTTARAAQYGGEARGDLRYPIDGPAIAAARATAISYWGANPCGGKYTMQWTALDEGTNATASWRNPTDAWNNPIENFDCRIDINPGADYDYPKLCTVLTHEIGHLLGNAHDPNPGQLMSAYYTSSIPQCDTAEPGAPAATPAPAPATGTADATAPASTPRRTLTTAKKTRKVRRCVIRRKGGKRVKRCFMVRARKAAKSARTISLSP